MSTFKSFEEIEAWQLAREIAKDIDAIIQTGSFGNRFKLIGQIEGSSGSMMDNIGEGLGRGGRNEFIQFLGYSKGSAEEFQSQLYRAFDFGCISKEQFDDLYSRTDKFCRMISNLMAYLNQSEIKGQKFKNRIN